LIAGVCAASTPIDLHASVRAIDRPSNWIYHRRFVTRLCERYRRRHASDPARFPLDGIDKVKTIFEFDDCFTAKAFGFGDAPNYYATQSALQFLPSISVPTLLLQAKDDPMIPFEVFECDQIRSNSYVELMTTENGGHLGFISRERPRFWADEVLTGWIVERSEGR
jgi:predicted alpha/beta-fold hydrolase